ncbi:MAG: PKD domain-containing protein [Desulfobacterales bacterium]|nr:PKD domain-containing protein [Desulfobacterales bacterium]
MKKSVVVLLACLCVPALIYATNLELEDVNFPFDSKSVVDDLKQFPHLADLMKQHPDVYLEITGHTDTVGGKKYNNSLSKKRAEAVKQLLINQGVSSSRISIIGLGKSQVKAKGSSPESHFMNRRVVFNLYKLVNGQKDYYYKENECLKPLTLADNTKPIDKGIADSKSTSDIMQRLDQLENKLLDNCKSTETKKKYSKSYRSTVYAGIGSNDGRLAGAMDGMFFYQIVPNVALQTGIKGIIDDQMNEYQMDFGLIGKFRNIQLGSFASYKWVQLDNYDTALLNQVGVDLSYQLANGTVGIFAAQPIQDKDTIASSETNQFFDRTVQETYIQAHAKAGISYNYMLNNGLYAEGNLGWIDSDDADVSGKLKVSYPLFPNESLRIFMQASVNNGYIKDGDEVTAMLGIELLNWKRPERCEDEIFPMTIPDISYTKKTQTKAITSGINLPPQVSIIASDVTGWQPLNITFTAVGSDPDGNIVSYDWNFGDGQTGSGAVVTHTFKESKTFLVTLKVKDNDGAEASANFTVSTLNELPVVSIIASDTEGVYPLPVMFIADATDSDGKIHSYYWNFSDGTYATGKQAARTFNQPGTYRVGVTVSDNQGGIRQGSIDIRVLDRKPIVDAGRDQNVDYQLDPIVLDGTGSYDPAGGDLMYYWNQLAGPHALMTDANSPVAYFIPTRVNDTYIFQLDATDERGGYNSDAVTYTVK